ncbi:MAG: ABC transporter permease [Candidatus Bilamarchaeaceae archaeon]
MKVHDAFFYAIQNMKSASLRSWLTIIGVIVGVIALICIMAVSEGVQQEIKNQLSAFGQNMMFVVPVNLEGSGASITTLFGAPSTSGKLTERDVQAVESVPGVKEVSKMIIGRASVNFKDKGVASPVYASDANVFEIFKDDFKLESGRYYRDGERNVVVVGNDVKTKLFGKRGVEIGSTLVINGKNFRVVGILEKFKGSFRQSDDAMILVPYEDGKELFSKQLAKNEVTIIYAEVYEGYNTKEIKERIEERIASNHKVSLDDKDFSVVTPDFVENLVGNVFFLLSSFLIVVTLISSVVAAIGVSNTMFMAVLERTREIGVLKAMGATEKDIMLIFIIESALIGLIGGLIGLAIAYGILQLIQSFGVPVWLRLRIIGFSILFSMLVGAIAGAIPARQAAKLDPVEALRS